MNIRYRMLCLMLGLFSSFCNAEIKPAEKEQLIAKLVSQISTYYVETGKVDQIKQHLEEVQNSTEYQNSVSNEQFATFLTGELQKVDKHFAIKWRSPVQQSQPLAKHESWFSKLARKNSGFNRVEILDGNVGYIDFWGFDALSSRSRQTVAQVMGFVAEADALILDLRNNGGGSGEMVQLISSYFLKPNTHLNSIYWHSSGTTQDFHTLDKIDGKVNLDVPIFILTSANTFSAAEEFAYNLKHLKRATLVGEVTKGGANPWRFYELTKGFSVAVPIAKAVNPITHSNWEAIGVKPHIESTSKDAYDIAYYFALKEVLKAAPDGYLQKEIKDILLTVEDKSSLNKTSP